MFICFVGVGQFLFYWFGIVDQCFFFGYIMFGFLLVGLLCMYRVYNGFKLVGLLLVLLIGLLCIVSGVHWPQDVLGGMLVGGLGRDGAERLLARRAEHLGAARGRPAGHAAVGVGGMVAVARLRRCVSGHQSAQAGFAAGLPGLVVPQRFGIGPSPELF